MEHVRGVSSFILFSSRTNYQDQLGSLEYAADFTHENYDLVRKVIDMFVFLVYPCENRGYNIRSCSSAH